MKKLPEINLEYLPRLDSHNPFTIAFCYPKVKEPFVVKGGWIEVEQHLLSLDFPVLVHVSHWFRKFHKNLIRAYNLNQEVFFEEGKNSGKRWRIFTFKNGVKTTLVLLNKVPRKWIRELDPYSVKIGREHKRLFRLEVNDV